MELSNLYLNNPNARVAIVNGDSIRVRGLLTDEFSISGQNDYESIFELTNQDSLQKFALQIASLTDRATNYIGMKTSLMENIRLKSAEQTEMIWMRSQIPVFSVSLMVLNLNKNNPRLGDVREQVKSLYAAVFPSITADLKVMNPPLGDQGSVTITIGQWFQAPLQIIRQVNFTFSKEVVDDGSPLYARGTVEFSPSKMPGSNEVIDYITNRKSESIT